MVKEDLIRIALAGKTNSGKTTMIRTLTRQAVGVIADRANVTQEVNKISSDADDVINRHIGIQAIFYDCPGFQMASLSRHFIHNLPELLKLDPKAKYDAIAIEAIKEVDVVLYVASLEDVPNDDYVNQIELIKALKKPCIVILNKFGQRVGDELQNEIKERAKQWKSKIHEISTFKVIHFDAHWKNPSSTNKLYKTIENLIPTERSTLFKAGLQKFYENQQNLRKRIALTIADLIIKSRESVNLDLFKDDILPEEEDLALKNKIENEITKAIKDYYEKIHQIYKLNATFNANDKIAYSKRSETHLSTVVSGGTASAGVGTVFGTAMGGAIGWVVGFFGTGGVGAVPAMLAGARFGATCTGILGLALGSIGSTNTYHEAQLDEEFLQVIFDKAVGLAYAMECHGFGLGTTLRDDDFRSIVEKAYKLRQKNYTEINFKSSTHQEIKLLAQTIFTEMESEKEIASSSNSKSWIIDAIFNKAA